MLRFHMEFSALGYPFVVFRICSCIYLRGVLPGVTFFIKNTIRFKTCGCVFGGLAFLKFLLYLLLRDMGSKPGATFSGF